MNTNTTFTDLTQIEIWNLDLVGNWEEYDRTVDANTNHLDFGFNVANEMNTNGLAHDDSGNLATDGTFEYNYDVENRLTRIIRVSDSAVLVEYYYDALGRRVRRVEDPAGTPAATLLIWDARWRLLETRNDNHVSNQTMQRFIHAGDSAYIDDHVAYDRWDSVGSDWNRYYYHTDKQFNTVAMTDSSGNVAEYTIIDPYGRALFYDNTWTAIGTKGVIDNPMLHQGLYRDVLGHGSTAGGGGIEVALPLYDNRARVYSPQLGRFLQRDPLGYVDGASLYSYTDGHPTSGLDWSGFLTVDGSQSGNAAATQPADQELRPFEPPEPRWVPPLGELADRMGDISRNEPPGPTNYCTAVNDRPGGIGNKPPFDFSAACKKHDECYDTLGKSRDDCDEEFYENMIEICSSQGARSAECQWYAALYWKGVRRWGIDPYRDAQRDAWMRSRRGAGRRPLLPWPEDRPLPGDLDDLRDFSSGGTTNNGISSGNVGRVVQW